MNFRFGLILLQNVHEFSPFNYNSSLWEYVAQRISQHNFLPDLDIDLEVGSFNLYSLGSILSITPYFYHHEEYQMLCTYQWHPPLPHPRNSGDLTKYHVKNPSDSPGTLPDVNTPIYHQESIGD